MQENINETLKQLGLIFISQQQGANSLANQIALCSASNPLCLFPPGKDAFYHPDIISRDEEQEEQG